jgi:hypothetical protein
MTMIIDTLPYLIQLIKQNLILQTLITTGSLQNVDFKTVSHDIVSDRAVEFFNFPLGSSEVFDQVTFTIEDSCDVNEGKNINVILTTDNPKYFDNAEFYFGGFEINKGNVNSNIRSISSVRKELGVFRIFENPVPPAFINIMQNPYYGYGIFISFYCDYKEKIELKQLIDQAFKTDSSNFDKPKKGF